MASTIPNEVLENIVKNLNTTSDVSRFRAVCKSWRSSAAPPCKKQLQFPIQVNINDYNMYTITESIVYRLAPVGDDPCQRGWLTKVEDREFGKTMLHPLSHNTLERQNSTPKVFNSLECWVFEMARLYKVHKLYDTKVALSSDLFFPAAMFVSGDGHLYYGKLGVGDKRCIQFSLVDPSHEGIRKCGFEDVIFYQGKFYAIYQDGRALVLYGSFRVRLIVLSTLDDQYSRGFHKRYLVDSLGELLLVDRLVSASKWTRWDQQLNEFKVYKLNADKGRWDELSAEALSDRILIVDNDDCCISISTQDFPGHSGNSIYFSTRLKYGLTFGKVGVFDLSNRSHSVSQFDRYNIFYPPPSS